MIKIPRVGDTVTLQIGAVGDEGEVAAYEFWTVERIDYFKGSQGLAFTLRHPSGVVTVIDQTDLTDGAYPFVMTIYTLVITHEYWTATFTFISEAGAKTELLSWVKEWCNDSAGVDDSIPEDADQAIERYFELSEREFYAIDRNFV